MTEAETQEAIRGVLQRAVNMAEMHGTAFIRVTNIPARGEVGFSVIHPEFVKVSYDQG